VLKYRVLTSLVLLPLALVGVFQLSLTGFALVMAVILLVGAWEWANLAGLQSLIARLAYVGLTAAMMLALVGYFTPQLPLAYWPSLVWPKQLANDAPLWVILAGVVWWLLAAVLVVTYPKNQTCWSWLKLPAGFLVLVPAWVALISLRASEYLVNPYKGAFSLLFVLLIIWGADTGAYFCGKAFGKHKLAPKVSPGKTWQGFAGALLMGAVLTGPGLWLLGLPMTALLRLLALIELTVVVSVFGDLLESLAKRERGVKDSGKLLPGHGGVLDRLDSLVAAAPVFVLGLFWLL
jgi:phosphatidate cytidylyltransferase